MISEFPMPNDHASGSSFTGHRRLVILWSLAIGHWSFGSGQWLQAQVPQSAAMPQSQRTNETLLIDLPTALRLAGARSLDIQIARERLAEAKANHESAVEQLFPWISPGATLRRHENRIQAVDGTILDADKQSYTIGGALTAQVDIGEAIYKSLAAKQLVKAADHALDAQRQDSVAAAAQGYFDLAFAQAAGDVSQEAVRISTNYEAQVKSAVEAGIAFKGDLLRVSGQSERNRLTLRQASAQQRVAAGGLAQMLHLDPSVELVARDTDLAPLTLTETNATLNSLVQRALFARPELKQSQAFVEAARESKNGAVYGPLIPSAGAQAAVGGLGGGKNNDWGNFGEQEDYFVGIGWRIGPGGLFDFPRQRVANARLNSARIGMDKIHDEIARQVVEAFTRMQSQSEQITTAKRGLTTAEEGLRLAHQRQEFGVGVVLEDILAEQDLTRARTDYLKAIAEFNKAQYGLARAVGGVQPPR